jgi:hypothetical protein
MPSLRSVLLAFVCVGLVASQVSGLHMHVGSHGYVGVPEGTHVHGWSLASDHDSHRADDTDDGHVGDTDYEGKRDVSVIELGAGASKVLIFFAWLAVGLVIPLRLGGSIRIPLAVPLPKTRRVRWRPPLRAPPLLSQP